MSTEQQTEETEDDGISLVANFYPRVDEDEEEDEDGNVRHEAIVRQLTFGMGEPKVLIEFAVNDRNEPLLALSVGDLTMEETQQVLDLVAEGFRQAASQQ